MEKKIVSTFLVVFALGAIIEYVYFGISYQKIQINVQIFQNAAALALVYLYWIWVFSRRHKFLAFLGTVTIAVFCICTVADAGELTNMIESIEWAGYLMILVSIASAIIAYMQGKKLYIEVQQESRTAEVVVKYKHDYKEK